MRLDEFIAGIVIACAAVPALAQSDGNTGRVDTVYVREARGLYIEKKLVRQAETKEVWVDVRFAAAPLEEVKSELFQVPSDIAIERGDLVSTRIGDSTLRSINLLPEVNRVTRLVAKHDTLMAMVFGLSNSSRPLGLFTEAQACRSTTRFADAEAYSK